MLRHVLLLEHWLQNCNLGHDRWLRSHRRIRRQSLWASCEFMYTPPTPTRRNSTVSSRRHRVLGITGVRDAAISVSCRWPQGRSADRWIHRRWVLCCRVSVRALRRCHTTEPTPCTLLQSWCTCTSAPRRISTRNKHMSRQTAILAKRVSLQARSQDFSWRGEGPFPPLSFPSCPDRLPSPLK